RAKDRVVKLKEVASPTFETLIEPLETSLRQVGQVSEIFSLFSLSHSSEEFKKIEPEIAELFSAFNTELFSDVQLFEQIKAVHAHRDTLAADQRRLVENFYKHFIRTGCNLDETKKKRFKEISQELAKLAVTFGQNIQKSTAAFKLVVKESQLKGLSNELVEKMKANA